MKRRRLILSIFLIAAIALLSIGYSAIESRLDISGTVSSIKSTDDFDVEFVGAELSGELPEGVSCAPTYDNATGLDATLNIAGLSNNGQKVVAYFKVQNNSKAIETLDATLTGFVINVTKDDVPVDSDTNPAANIFSGNYIKVTAEFADRAGEAGKAATGIVNGGLSATIDAKANDESVGQYVWVKVTVEVIGSFTDITTHNITIHFDAESK